MRWSPRILLHAWKDGTAIYWPMDDIGPMEEIPAEAARRMFGGNAEHGACTAVYNRTGNIERYVRETAAEIMAAMGVAAVSIGDTDAEAPQPRALRRVNGRANGEES